jgi:hypothetical protein
MSKDRSTPQSLDEILGRVRHTGSLPPATEDQVMDAVVDMIRTARAKRGALQEMETLDAAEVQFREGKMQHLGVALANLNQGRKKGRR